MVLPSYRGMALPGCHIHQKALGSARCCPRWLGKLAFSTPYHFCTCRSLPLPPAHLRPPLSCSTEEITLRVKRERSHRFGYHQRNKNEMFSLVSQKVMAQPPSANKKKQYDIREVLGTGSFGKVMVRVRAPRVYAL